MGLKKGHAMLTLEARCDACGRAVSWARSEGRARVSAELPEEGFDPLPGDPLPGWVRVTVGTDFDGDEFREEVELFMCSGCADTGGLSRAMQQLEGLPATSEEETFKRDPLVVLEEISALAERQMSEELTVRVLTPRATRARSLVSAIFRLKEEAAYLAPEVRDGVLWTKGASVLNRTLGPVTGIIVGSWEHRVFCLWRGLPQGFFTWKVVRGGD